MALTSTMYRFQIELSDVDRGVYDALDIRAAQHPSESVPYLLTRVLALALEHRLDLSFGRGLSDPDEPTISAPNAQAGIALWIEIGAPAAPRMHKISKRADEVLIYTHKPLDLVVSALSGQGIHRAEEIEIIAIPDELLQALVPTLNRKNTWTLLRTEGTLYITVGESTVVGALTRASIAP